MNIAIILAGGVGSRVGCGGVPKQYVLLDGMTVFGVSLSQFLIHEMVDYIIPVIHREHADLYGLVFDEIRAACNTTRYMSKLLPPAIGGANRMLSSCAGFCAIGQYVASGLLPRDVNKVLVHDAARPFVDAALISSVIRKLNVCDLVDMGVDVVDTIRCVTAVSTIQTLQRNVLYAVQTPQGMRYARVVGLYKRIGARCNAPGALRFYDVDEFTMLLTAKFTDDINFCITEGKVRADRVDGSAANFKITTMQDLQYARYILRQNDDPQNFKKIRKVLNKD